MKRIIAVQVSREDNSLDHKAMLCVRLSREDVQAIEDTVYALRELPEIVPGIQWRGEPEAVSLHFGLDSATECETSEVFTWVTRDGVRFCFCDRITGGDVWTDDVPLWAIRSLFE